MTHPPNEAKDSNGTTLSEGDGTGSVKSEGSVPMNITSHFGPNSGVIPGLGSYGPSAFVGNSPALHVRKSINTPTTDVLN